MISGMSERYMSGICINGSRELTMDAEIIAYLPAYIVVRPEGLEPSTLGLRVPCSAKLSYGRTRIYIMESGVEKGKGEESGVIKHSNAGVLCLKTGHQDTPADTTLRFQHKKNR